MKKYPAIATVEFSEIAAGMFATDALIKKAPIALLKCGTISRGRYLTLIAGSTASVLESYEEGLFHGGDRVIDHVFLPDIHPAVHHAVLGQRTPCRDGALAVVETETSSSNIRAAELALKGTSVNLVEIRLADSLLHGKGVSIFNGELHDIEAAVDIALTHLEARQIRVTHRIITRPSEYLEAQINHSTEFRAANFMELDGEDY